jgi:hypothetical protein
LGAKFTYVQQSPTQFKIGDIAEAVLTFICYPTQKGTVKMAIGLKALAMLDHTTRDVSAPGNDYMCDRTRLT